MSPKPVPHSVYDIKSADLPLLAFQLKSLDLSLLAQALQEQLQETPDFFQQDATLIDLDPLAEVKGDIDFQVLVALLKQRGLRAIAVKSVRPDWLQAASQAGLIVADDARIRRAVPAPTEKKEEMAVHDVTTPVLNGALVLDKPLRSGQQCYAKGRDLVVLSMVNPGAEVLADGHIHVYAPLRGKAIAGAKGDPKARIFAMHMDPELISIAGVYRTSEQALPPDVRGLAAQVALHSSPDGDKLVITALKA